MKNRASSHLLLLLLIVLLQIAGYTAIHRAGLLRGYETSTIGAARDLLMYVPIIALLLWLSRVMRFSGNWVLFTAAVVLFSVGLLIQYRLYSDPEYNSRNRAQARMEKTAALRTRYIMENYEPAKKLMMGCRVTPAQPVIDMRKEATTQSGMPDRRFTCANSLSSPCSGLSLLR
jgi:hypothetical protein